MKQNWEQDELIEFWTLLPTERKFLEHKIGVNRLIYGIFLKFFQYAHRFPDKSTDIPESIIKYIAPQVDIPVAEYYNYQWQHRSIMRFRGEIRNYFGIKKATDKDIEDMTNWLISSVLSQESDFEHLYIAVERKFFQLQIETPTDNRIERLIRSAVRQFENELFETICQSLSDETRTNIDKLLITGDKENEEVNYDKPSLFSYLNSDPGRVSLDIAIPTFMRYGEDS